MIIVTLSIYFDELVLRLFSKADDTLLTCYLTTKFDHAFEEKFPFIAIQQDFLIWDAVTTILDMLQNVLKTVFMLVKFLYCVDNTAKCVPNFFCCEGTFGRTT